MLLAKKHSVLPGFGLALGFTLLYLSLVVLVPLSTLFWKSAGLGAVGLLAGRHRAARGRLLQADLRGVVRGRGHQRRLRPGRDLGPRPLPLPGPAPHGRSRGLPLRPAHRGGRHHPHDALRAQRLARRAPREARDQGRRSRPSASPWPSPSSACPSWCAPSSPCSRASTPRWRRRRPASGASRFQTILRVVLPALFPAWLTGFALAFARALGRVRLGRLHRRQHADEDRDHASAHHHQARAVRLRGGHRHRGGDPAWLPSCCSSPSTASSPGARAWGRRSRMATTALSAPATRTAARATSEPVLVKVLLIAVAVGFLALFLVLPLVAVFAPGLREGRGRLRRRPARAHGRSPP